MSEFNYESACCTQSDNEIIPRTRSPFDKLPQVCIKTLVGEVLEQTFNDSLDFFHDFESYQLRMVCRWRITNPN